MLFGKSLPGFAGMNLLGFARMNITVSTTATRTTGEVATAILIPLCHNVGARLWIGFEIRTNRSRTENRRGALRRCAAWPRLSDTRAILTFTDTAPDVTAAHQGGLANTPARLG
jgi:hypothetical protein